MSNWWLTKDGDKSCLELYERHYSAYKYKDGRQRLQFVGPGYSIVLRTARADAAFVWRDYIDKTIPKQEGVECSFFRNEGPVLSSKLIRQADAVADFAWPGERHYTKVNSEEVGSGLAGYCFLRAGWRYCGETKGGLLIMERPARKSTQVAKYCANWKNGYCQVCGVQSQGHEVTEVYRCPHFKPRTTSTVFAEEDDQ